MRTKRLHTGPYNGLSGLTKSMKSSTNGSEITISNIGSIGKIVLPNTIMNSWEPESTLTGALAAIARFEKKIKRQKN